MSMTAVVDISREKAGDRKTNGDGVVQSHRLGAQAKGLYPSVSRTKLAGVMGKHVSTITHWLVGRTRPGLEAALLMADYIGVSVEQLNRDLQQAQAGYRARGQGRARGRKSRRKKRGGQV
jgi:plasmid maintenance system antidote protein VapI